MPLDGRLVSLYAWFRGYAGRFHSEDPDVCRNIEIKEAHTYRVCRNMVEIAGSLGLSREEASLAETIALFHDIGRFEQLLKYGTFSDRDSVDHAALGIEILKSSDVLSCLSDREKDIVLRSIQLHNCFSLPEDEPDEVLLYSKLIRDADKLDILGIVVSYSEGRQNDRNQAMEMGLPDLPECSVNVESDLLRGCMVRIGDLKTYNDLILLYLSWAYDIYFPYTLECIKERRYMERLASNLPETCRMRQICSHMRYYIDGRLGSV